MLLSYIVYSGLLLICGWLSYLADRRNSKLFVWGIILSLTIVAGLRAYSVGLDTQNYVEKFAYIYRGRFRYAYGLENSFKYFCYVVLHIIPSASFLLGLLAFITNAGIILRFWELRTVSSFQSMVLFYYMSFYFMSLNGMRQFVAVAILFWGTRYLSQKKILRFVICVYIASLFHRTAIVGLFFLLYNVFQWKDLNRGQRQSYILLILCIPGAFVYLVQILRQYAQYFSQISLNMGLVIPVKIILWGLGLFLAAHSGTYRSFLSGLKDSERFEIRFSGASYILALILASSAYFFPTFVERVSWYFYIFEGVFYGSLLKNTEKGTAIPLGIMILLLTAYGFLYSMIHNSQGTMPYVFI